MQRCRHRGVRESLSQSLDGVWVKMPTRDPPHRLQAPPPRPAQAPTQTTRLHAQYCPRCQSHSSDRMPFLPGAREQDIRSRRVPASRSGPRQRRCTAMRYACAGRSLGEKCRTWFTVLVAASAGIRQIAANDPAFVQPAPRPRAFQYLTELWRCLHLPELRPRRRRERGSAAPCQSAGIFPASRARRSAPRIDRDV